VALYKSLTFGVSALYTGVAGALGAIAVEFVAPDSFSFNLAIAMFVGLVIGGVGSIPGTLFAGLFVLFVPNLAEQVSKGLAQAVYGVILIVVIYVMPSGAVGFVRMICNRMRGPDGTRTHAPHVVSARLGRAVRRQLLRTGIYRNLRRLGPADTST
jgi:branched-chain amino acid transport system permease protein